MQILEIQKKSILQFFSKPSIGIIGTVASIIGIFLSIYFYQASREKPELTYYVNPAKAAVFRTGQISNIDVQFEGKKLKSDITATQIAFWNAGKKPIRANSMLTPFTIKTDNKFPILEAKIRKEGRPVSKINIDSSRIGSGEITVDWNILEQNDGGVVQIIYLGNESVGITANAVLEGQKQIESWKSVRTFLLSLKDEKLQNIVDKLISYLLFIFGILLILYSIISLSVRKQLRFTTIVIFIQGIITGIFAYFTLNLQTLFVPPFGF